MKRHDDPRSLHQAEHKHPERWERDLNPNRMAGQHIGARSVDVREDVRYASDVKELTRELEGFTFDELQQIPVLLPGARLEQGATYVDVTDPRRTVFRATGDARVPRDRYLVPKAAVHYEHWNRLTEPT